MSRTVRCPLLIALTVLPSLATVGCESAPYLRQRGIEACQDARYERAEALLTRAVKLDPGVWQAHMVLGQVHLKRAKYLEAQHELELALSMNPSSDHTPEILDALAETLLGQGNAGALHALLGKACADYGTTRDYLRQARFLGRLGDLDNAKIALGKASHFAAPDDPDAQLALADFYESIGNEREAIQALRHALYIDPDNAVIQKRLRAHGVIPGPTAAISPKP